MFLRTLPKSDTDINISCAIYAITLKLIVRHLKDQYNNNNLKIINIECWWLVVTSISTAASKNNPTNSHGPCQPVKASVDGGGHSRQAIPSKNLRKVEAIDNKITQNEGHNPAADVHLLRKQIFLSRNVNQLWILDNFGACFFVKQFHNCIIVQHLIMNVQ